MSKFIIEQVVTDVNKYSDDYDAYTRWTIGNDVYTSAAYYPVQFNDNGEIVSKGRCKVVEHMPGDEWLAVRKSLTAADSDFVPTEMLITKPYPNEHACRLNPPGKYDRFARGTRKHGEKQYSVIFGIKEGKSEQQALRYNRGTWSASEASAHCKSHGGKFEAAVKKVDTGTVEKDIYTFDTHEHLSGKWHFEHLGNELYSISRDYAIERIIKRDDEKHIIIGVVLVPDEPDHVGDKVSAEEIENACYSYMMNRQVVKIMHEGESIGCPVVLCWLTMEKRITEVGILPKGTWLLGVKVLREDVWKRVRNKELNGFSIGGRGHRDYGG